jgi:HEPN domain-containing protein
MLTRKELQKIARARLKDAQILFQNRRYDGAAYLCGYAIELWLKARICRTLGWEGFPSTNREFQSLLSFKTHDLDILLKLSGVEKKIKTRFLAEWSVISAWRPEVRYQPIGTIKRGDAKMMIESAMILMRNI